MNRVHQIVCLKLRILHTASQADGAEYAPARRNDMLALTAGAALKNLPRQRRRPLETADWIALAESIRVAARGHDHAERRARVPSNLVPLQGARKRRLAQLDQIALQAHQD